MKKIKCYFIFIALITYCISVHAEIIKSGNCGKNGSNVTFSLDDKGCLRIEGEGDIADYPDYTSIDVVRYKIKQVIINKGITSLGKYAFSYCSNLASITIPNSVISIGEDAFTGCRSLTSITIPNSMTSIGNRAFRNCM